MEYLKEVDDRGKDGAEKSQPGHSNPPAYAAVGAFAGRPGHARAASTPVVWNPPSAPNERTGLVRSFSMANIDDLNEEVDYAGSKPAGGTIMGIHNLAIVFPQFLVSQRLVVFQLGCVTDEGVSYLDRGHCLSHFQMG